MTAEKPGKPLVINNFVDWFTIRETLKKPAGKFGEQVLTP